MVAVRKEVDDSAVMGLRHDASLLGGYIKALPMEDDTQVKILRSLEKDQEDEDPKPLEDIVSDTLRLSKEDKETLPALRSQKVEPEKDSHQDVGTIGYAAQMRGIIQTLAEDRNAGLGRKIQDIADPCRTGLMALATTGDMDIPEALGDLVIRLEGRPDNSRKSALLHGTRVLQACHQSYLDRALAYAARKGHRDAVYYLIYYLGARPEGEVVLPKGISTFPAAESCRGPDPQLANALLAMMAKNGVSAPVVNERVEASVKGVAPPKVLTIIIPH